MGRKLAGLLTLGLAAVMTAVAAPVSPQKAATTGGQFLKTHVEGLGTRASLTPSRVAFTSTLDGFDCFYVVSNKDAGCFALISADDRLPEVLGWSDKGDFNAEDIPSNVAWWFSEYNKQIAAFLAANPDVDLSTRSVWYPENKQMIEPLLKTTWNQSAPYNNMCPKQGTERSVTGCVATAMAQCMKYYEWPVYPVGKNDLYTFQGTTLDWANMIDNYPFGGYTGRQANAVALLMLQCGRSVDMTYSPNESGAQGNMPLKAWTTYFDYSKDLRLHYRDYYDSKTWENMVYNELINARPVFYSGYSYAGGHAFVCDGYKEGYYHFNWGWGGYQDGYFLLNALNPEAGGIGSYIGGYNLGQLIYTNLMKNNGSTDIQYMMLCNGNFVYEDDEFKAVPKAEDSKGVFFNPLSYTQNVAVGLKLTDKQGNFLRYITCTSRNDLKPNYGMYSFKPDMPELSDGEYIVYPAYNGPDKEWRDIMVMYGCQQYVELTVKDGQPTWNNPGVPAEMKSSIVISDPIVSPNVSKGCPVRVSYYVTNVGPGDYSGYILGRLTAKDVEPSDENYDFTALSLNKGQTERIDLVMTAPTADEAQLELVTDSYEPIGTPTTIKINGKLKDGRTEGRKLNASVLDPTLVHYSKEAPIMMMVENISGAVVNVTFAFEISDETGKVVRAADADMAIDLPKDFNSTVDFGSIDLGLKPGNYYMTILDSENNVLSAPYPFQVIDGPITDDFATYYTIVDETSATISRPMFGGSYSENAVIPEKVGNYTITGLEGNAIVNSPMLEALTIPATVERLGSSLLYMTPKLHDLTMLSAAPCSISPDVIEPEGFWNVKLHVPAGSENLYMHSDVWGQFYMPRWTMEIPADVTISGLQTDTAGKVYAPYYVSGDSELTFEIGLPEGMGAIVWWQIQDTNQQYYAYQNAGKVTLPKLGNSYGVMNIRLVDAAGVDESAAASHLSDVYTPTGVCVLRQASAEEINALPAGIYVVNGKKLVIR